MKDFIINIILGMILSLNIVEFIFNKDIVNILFITLILSLIYYKYRTRDLDYFIFDFINLLFILIIEINICFLILRKIHERVF